jgi:hypothetical protein
MEKAKVFGDRSVKKLGSCVGDSAIRVFKDALDRVSWAGH